MTSTAAPAESEATDWVGEATRRLAGASVQPAQSAGDGPARRWADDTLERVRIGVMQQVASLPRRTRPLDTVNPTIKVSQLALFRAIGAALASDRELGTAIVADVALVADDAHLTGVHVHLVAVYDDPQAGNLRDAGDRLRAKTSELIGRTIGTPDVRVDLTWDDVVLREA